MTFPRFAPAAVAVIALLLTALILPAKAETVTARHRFTDTGNGTQSHYALGSTPYSELLQASDGNFYGTTVYGGSGLCPNTSTGGVLGCGTVFQMTPQGKVTTLYSFPYDTTTGTAASGAFPTAGLIQGADGYLYGVAQDGGVARCNGALGCGTMFRISTAGVFTLLHQFCSGDGCPTSTEGGRPMAHLEQLPSGKLCDTTAEGGFGNEGTVFCASTGGSVTTLHDFQYENGTDGYDPIAALLVGPDGETLYGTTTSRGANGGGTVFALKNGTMTTLYAFSNTASGACYTPQGALIFGADGKLYGTTSSGGGGGGCIFSLATDGAAFAMNYNFPITSNAPADPVAGLVLARDGMMYGTTLFGSLEQTYGKDDGIAFRFDPATGAFTELADFNGTVGSAPRAVLIEGSDKYLYGTASQYGGSNKLGPDAGSVVRLSTRLKE
jgi:uncharacterized repeat protein (TIGR03803 family)